MNNKSIKYARSSTFSSARDSNPSNSGGPTEDETKQ